MSKQLKLGFMIGYWGAGPPANAPELLAEAERLGYDSAWTAEAYGSDALTPLAWWGSQTSRIHLGTSIAQIAARTPTAMAMAAITMDHLTNGRFILGQCDDDWARAPGHGDLERATHQLGDAVAVLDQFGLPHEVRVVSAHRTPDDMVAYGHDAAAPL